MELSEPERGAAVAALYAYREETLHYLRGYEQPDQTHDKCCTYAEQRATMRRQAQDSLNARLRTIDGALMALDTDAVL